MALMNKIKDFVERDEMWKTYIRKEDDSFKNWKENWGWMLDEYQKLKKKLDEKTETSEYLARVSPPKIIDTRKLPTIPNSTNHEYGFLCNEDNFKLEKYGSDYFKPKELPSYYFILKN